MAKREILQNFCGEIVLWLAVVISIVRAVSHRVCSKTDEPVCQGLVSEHGMQTFACHGHWISRAHLLLKVTSSGLTLKVHFARSIHHSLNSLAQLTRVTSTDCSTHDRAIPVESFLLDSLLTLYAGESTFSPCRGEPHPLMHTHPNSK